jgi:fucose permease
VLVIIAYAGFVGLGMSSSILGVAWPSMRETFVLSLDSVGILFICGTIGYSLASFYCGPLISRIGLGLLLVISALLVGAANLGYALAPSWWMVVILALVNGLGGGAIDSSFNTYFAANHSPRLMNWLHACFGLGATLGPLVMTALLNADVSWRVGYVVLSALTFGLLILFLFARNRWYPIIKADANAVTGQRAKTTDTLKLALVWLGIVLFVANVSVEATAGNWSFTLFTEGRLIPLETAGLWVSIFWASLTVGRVIFGIIVERFSITTMLRLSMLGCLVGAILMSLASMESISFLGLALIGFWLAPAFPLLIANTQKILGPEHAANAIGFQVGAAGIGFAVLPGLVGVLARSPHVEGIRPFITLMPTIERSALYNPNLEVIVLCLIALSVFALVLHEVIIIRSRAHTASVRAQMPVPA